MHQSSTHLPLVIGIISGSSAVLLILGIVIFICCTTHRANLEGRRRTPYGFSSGIASASPRGPVDTWRKNAAEASPISPQSAMAVSPSTNEASHRSPPADYPDYVPYRGPVEPKPAFGRNDEPPSIAGGNPMAQGWLQARSTSPTPSFATSFGESDEYTQHGRYAPPPLLPALRNGGYFHDIALQRYEHSDLEHGTSPGSRTSSHGLTGTTARAVGATRSIARLWPSRDAIPSNLRRTSGNPRTDSMIYVPSYSTAGNLSSSPNQLIGSSFVSRSNTNEPHSYHPSSHPSSMHTLRRGVSIKSAKTMRSFFSGLLFQSSSSSPIAQTPALPQPAARPDSGIFPNGSLSRSNSSRAGPLSIGSGTRREVPPSLRLEGGRETSPNLFIELNPNSPMTVAASSRPDSEWTQWR